MLPTLQRGLLPRLARWACSARACSTKGPAPSPPVVAAQPNQPSTPSTPSDSAGSLEDIPSYRPDDLDKRILVHFKYFPSMEAVPARVSQGKMNQAKSRARIKAANAMILATVCMCLVTVIFAKSQSRQNSLVEENFRRHVRFKKEGDDGSQSSRLGLVTNTKQDAEE